jgi:hypothetical protein
MFPVFSAYIFEAQVQESVVLRIEKNGFKYVPAHFLLLSTLLSIFHVHYNRYYITILYY